MKTYENNIILNLGAHIHRASIKAPVSEIVNDLNLVILVTPSISPVYFNNPAFTVLRLEDRGFDYPSLKVHSVYSKFL